MSSSDSLARRRAALFCGDSAAMADYEKSLQQAAQQVQAWLRRPLMYEGGGVNELRRHIAFAPKAEGVGLQKALQRASELFLHNSLKVHSVNSLAHLHCPTLVASQIAEVLINAANQSMDSWDQSPAASLMEQQMIAWLCSKIGYAHGDGVFTSGGTQSNLMGLLLARDACISKQFTDAQGRPWSVQSQGLPAQALQKVKFLCSANAHFSVQKNMALLGLGFQSVLAVAVNASGQMDWQSLQKTLDDERTKGNIIAGVVATAGTTDAGAIDDIAAICAIAETAGAWVHVDAAWGGALLLSGRYRQRLAGIEQADSVTLDFHKQFFQSISCGAFLLKERSNYRFMHYEAEYLNSAYDEAHGVPNLVAKSLQTTRRFDALKLWLSLEALGETLYGEMIDSGIDLAQQVGELIAQQEQFELLMPVQLASVLFRVVPKNYPQDLLDSLNQNIADELFAHGLANVGVTKVANNEKSAAVTSLKMTLLNPIATFANVQQLLTKVLDTASAIKDAIAQGDYQAVID